MDSTAGAIAVGRPWHRGPPSTSPASSGRRRCGVPSTRGRRCRPDGGRSHDDGRACRPGRVHRAHAGVPVRHGAGRAGNAAALGRNAPHGASRGTSAPDESTTTQGVQHVPCCNISSRGLQQLGTSVHRRRPHRPGSRRRLPASHRRNSVRDAAAPGPTRLGDSASSHASRRAGRSGPHARASMGARNHDARTGAGGNSPGRQT